LFSINRLKGSVDVGLVTSCLAMMGYKWILVVNSLWDVRGVSHVLLSLRIVGVVKEETRRAEDRSSVARGLVSANSNFSYNARRR
jgi:hypothetical protein